MREIGYNYDTPTLQDLQDDKQADVSMLEMLFSRTESRYWDVELDLEMKQIEKNAREYE